MPKKNNKILKYNPGEKSLKVPFIIYADLECILQKINACQKNPTKSYTEKKAKHEPSGYSLVTYCSFDKSKNEIKYCRGEDCMKMFCKDLKDQATKIINYEKKEIPLTDKEKEKHENKKICCICEQEFVLIKIKKNLKRSRKSEIMIIIQENIEELLIVFVIYDIKYRKRFL